MSKPVLFVSFRPLERAENLRAIYEAYTGDKVHMLSSDVNYLSEVQSGKYNLMVTDDFPYVSPGKTIVIWHGIQGGKTIGLDQPGQPYFNHNNTQLITYIVSAGTGMIDTWHRCTGVPIERILPLGMPRTDQYIGYKHEPGEKKKYLFVPTFRDKGDTKFPPIDWAYLDMILNDDEEFIVKAHPWQNDVGINQLTPQPILGFRKHITYPSPALPTTSFLYDADVVITDYSSIMFDAFLLNKPVVLFEKIPGYVDTRGMYLVYPNQYCPFMARNEIGLIEAVRDRVQHPELTLTEKYCREIVSDMCDGHACERLVNLINEINK